MRLQNVQIGVALVACILLLETSALSLFLLLPPLIAALSLRLQQRGPRALVLMADEWHLVYEQSVSKAQLHEQVYCGELLQLLQFRVTDDKCARPRVEWVLILPDTADAAARRQLRTLLRWYPFPGESASA